MSRREQLQREYEGRVERTRLESALPPVGANRRRSKALTVVLLLVLLAVACGAVWFFLHGGR